MLVIRMQRTGRKGHAQFRVVVQDSRRTPTSGKIVAALGHFNPHTKETTLNKEKAAFYLEHGAQPSDRVVRLLKAEGVKLPKWAAEPTVGERKIRNPEKLRKNRPAEQVVAADEAPAPAAEAPEAEPQASEAPAEDAAPAAEEAAVETPAEEPAAEPTETATDEVTASEPAAEPVTDAAPEAEAPAEAEKA